MERMFASSSVEEVDFSGLTLFQSFGASETFNSCQNLVNVLGVLDGEYNYVSWGFENCPKLETVRFKKESIMCDINIAESPKLTAATVQSIIDGMNTGATGTWFLHNEVKSKLTEKQKKEITDKGWSVQ